MTDTDSATLHALSKQLAVGAYQAVVNEATNPATRLHSETAARQRRVVLARAYLAQGRAKMAAETLAGGDEATHTHEARALALLAASALDTASASASSAGAAAVALDAADDGDVAVLAASTLLNAGRPLDALAVLAPFRHRSLDAAALFVQALLLINRPDIARQEIATLKAWADDASLAQLAEAWCALSDTDANRAQDAFYTFDELASAGAATAKLLISKAVAQILSSKFAEAEQLLAQALNWNNSDPEALINLIVCANATGKSADVSAGYIKFVKFHDK
ncbi:hypothetical protein HK100_003937 [Physocladia obscura]|uniref:Coatomer subunit epsilon n=1 Tax=Physocladia obscura TaxID=109957 RepID=A0AAD5SW28_9FUNG|nr:hypothetical protein HK100_003937 [Physocladia obscura]